MVDIRYVQPRPLGSLIVDLRSYFFIHHRSASTSSDPLQSALHTYPVFNTITIGSLSGSPYFFYLNQQATGHAFSRILSLSTALVSVVVYPPFFSVPILCSHQIKELLLLSIDEEMLAFLFRSPEGSFNHLEDLHVKGARAR